MASINKDIELAKAVGSDVITYYHLASIVSFCIANNVGELEVRAIQSMNGEKLLKEGVFVLDGLRVRICYGSKENETLSCSLFVVLSRLFSLVSDRSSQTWIGHHSYFKPNYIASRYISRAKTFSFEEGIGTFGSLGYHRNVARRENHKFPILKFMTKKILSSRLFVDYPWYPVAENDPKKIAFLKKSFELIGFEIFQGLADELKSFSGKPVVVILGAPLVRLGLIDGKEYEDVLSRLVSKIESNGCLPVYKAHHLEIIDGIKLFDSILKTPAPAEVLVSVIAPKSVVGFSSGALISSSKIFGVEAYNATSLLPENVREAISIDGHLRKIFDSCVLEF